MEKEVKEDWDVVKDAAKEDWKVVKEEAKEDWNKLDLEWNKLALSDSKVVPGETAESEEAESEGKKEGEVFVKSVQILCPTFRRKNVHTRLC